MPRVRILSAGRKSDEELSLRRLGLPASAREYLVDRVLPIELLITGLVKAEAGLLRRLQETLSETLSLPLYVAGENGAALVSGRQEQIERWLGFLDDEPDGLTVSTAVRASLRGLEPLRALRLGEAEWDFGRRTYVMGVVNVTPDSFSDGGKHSTPEAAVAHGVALATAGADMLDVGGESTRPGAAPISDDEELGRVLPVIRGLRAKTLIPISIDTRKSRVAEEALAAGAVMVNDVSGLTFDPQLAKVVAKHGAALCVMHMRGSPPTMQDDPLYEDVVDEVLEGLAASLSRADSAGVLPGSVLVDPGIGFGKTAGHNLFLLRFLRQLRALGKPILIGTSRKSFLGKLSRGKPPELRLAASLASVAICAAQGGADVVRVHDVAETRDAVAVADAIRDAREGGSRYDT